MSAGYLQVTRSFYPVRIWRTNRWYDLADGDGDIWSSKNEVTVSKPGQDRICTWTSQLYTKLPEASQRIFESVFNFLKGCIQHVIMTVLNVIFFCHWNIGTCITAESQTCQTDWLGLWIEKERLVDICERDKEDKFTDWWQRSSLISMVVRIAIPSTRDRCNYEGLRVVNVFYYIPFSK